MSNWSKQQTVEANKAQKQDLNTLATLIGVETPDEWGFELDFSEAYSYAYKAAIADGATEEEAEEKAQQAEQEEQDEAWGKYADAVYEIAEDLLNKHGLTLVPLGKGPRPFEFKIEPEKSWEDAAAEIIKTINGVGSFEFASVREFLGSGPYTARQAVLGHLHWIKRYPDVYGDSSPRTRLDRALRY